MQVCRRLSLSSWYDIAGKNMPASLLKALLKALGKVYGMLPTCTLISADVCGHVCTCVVCGTPEYMLFGHECNTWFCGVEELRGDDL